MSAFNNYSPLKNYFTFAGIPFTGYAPGTFIDAERESDSFEMSAGAGGDVVRIQKFQRNGSFTITLMAESPTNDLLSAKLLTDELFGTGVGRAFLKDLNGSTVLEATYAWIRKQPKVSRSDGANTVEWIIDCHELFGVVGGSLAP